MPVAKKDALPPMPRCGKAISCTEKAYAELDQWNAERILRALDKWKAENERK